MNSSLAKIEPQRSAIWILLSTCVLLVAVCTGCQPEDSAKSDAVEEETPIEVSVPDPLTVLVVDAPELGPQIKRQWRARRDGELTVLDVTAAQWHQSNYETEADVVLYSPGLLPNLVDDDRLLPVPDDVWKSEDVNHRDILKRSRQGVLEYDDQIWALPLASPQWMLLYRSDLLEQAKVDVPTTWSEWSLAVDALRAADFPIAVEDRVIIPLAENWAAHAFLLRCAATIRQRGKLSSVFDRSSMKPLINQEPFVDALKDLKTTFGDQKGSITPAEAWTRLQNGKCVMTLAWPMNLPQDDLSSEPESESEVAEWISTAAVPGSGRWFDLQAGEWFEREAAEDQRVVDYMGFGGLLGSVSGETRHAASSFEFLQWLCSQSISSTVLNGSQQSGPFRKSHLKAASRWSGSQLAPPAAESMADLIRTAHSNPVALVFPRIPGYHDYLQSLDKHVRECLAGKSSAVESLESVAKQWEAITEGIGRTEQTANLRRGNGL